MENDDGIVMNKKLLQSLVIITLINTVSCYAPEHINNKQRVYAKQKWWYKPAAYLGYWFYDYPYQLPYDSQKQTSWQVINKTEYEFTMYTNDTIIKIPPNATQQVPHLKSFAFTLTNKQGDTIQYTTSNHTIKIKEDPDKENVYITTKA